MTAITAILQTCNDSLRLGRAMETLYPCDEIIVVDQGSSDGTVQLAREFGAHIVGALAGASPRQYLKAHRQGWILCLDPRESLTESLAASLFEWKLQPPLAPAFSFHLREETVAGWTAPAAPQTRLVPVGWERWNGMLPAHDPSSLPLEGEILRFAFP
jgi:hypothetical protein